MSHALFSAEQNHTILYTTIAVIRIMTKWCVFLYHPSKCRCLFWTISFPGARFRVVETKLPEERSANKTS